MFLTREKGCGLKNVTVSEFQNHLQTKSISICHSQFKKKQLASVDPVHILSCIPKIDTPKPKSGCYILHIWVSKNKEHE